MANSHAGLALASEMDGVVLVIDAENTNPKDAIDLKDFSQNILHLTSSLFPAIIPYAS